ncbi:hypothetical protein [Methylobacterium sp. V23]|uniref:hypothetical protein n=1 Tax=Methylobacterium sp. V23 TaxID=2044878 RepID=UPI0011AFF8A2|nr:hypothetical protein [Methylobacterium sp. V23]
MTDRANPVKDLEDFRKVLVNERRVRVATALDLRDANGGEGGLWGSDVKSLQEQIGAIDRAIEDETKLIPPRYMSSGLAGS